MAETLLNKKSATGRREEDAPNVDWLYELAKHHKEMLGGQQ